MGEGSNSLRKTRVASPDSLVLPEYVSLSLVLPKYSLLFLIE